MKNLLVILLLLTSSALCAQVISSARIVQMDGNAPIDSALDCDIAVYRQRLERDLSKVVGYSDSLLIAKRPSSPLGSFLADAILDAAKDYLAAQETDSFKENLPRLVALTNTGGIRAALPEGEITLADMYSITPFRNSLTFVWLSGNDFYQLCQHIARRKGEPIAGFTFSIDSISQKPVDIKVHGKALDPKATYILATNDYLADLGDGFDCLQGQPRHSTNITIRDILHRYIAELHSEGERVTPPENYNRINYLP